MRFPLALEVVEEEVELTHHGSMSPSAQVKDQEECPYGDMMVAIAPGRAHGADNKLTEAKVISFQRAYLCLPGGGVFIFLEVDGVRNSFEHGSPHEYFPVVRCDREDVARDKGFAHGVEFGSIDWVQYVGD